MALIKCTECGHEISDKAKSCIYCGCPIEEQNIKSIKKGEIELTNKNNETENKEVLINTEKEFKTKKSKTEKEIIKAEIDIERIDYEYKTAVVGIIISIIILEMFYTSIDKSIFLTTLFISILIITPIFLMLYFTTKAQKKAYLVLTSERIYGTTPISIGQTLEIDFPIKQISAISKISKRKSNSLIVEVSSSTRYIINYVKNADEFRKEFLNVIKKNDN